MEYFGLGLSIVGFGLSTWCAMIVVFALAKARRTRVSLQNVRDFMSRRDASRGKAL